MAAYTSERYTHVYEEYKGVSFRSSKQSKSIEWAGSHFRRRRNINKWIGMQILIEAGLFEGLGIMNSAAQRKQPRISELVEKCNFNLLGRRRNSQDTETHSKSS